MSGWWVASYVALWGLVLVLVVLVVALARQVGVLHLRLGPRGALELDEEGPPLGEAPEVVSALDLEGRPVSVGGPGEQRLLLFVSPECPLCRQVLPSVPAVARGGRLAPVVISDDDGPDAVAAYRAAGVDVPVVAGPDVAERYQIPGTPYAVVMDLMGVVRAKGTVNNLEQMEGLVETAIHRLEAPLGVPE
jgi:methylamine dehydrogenase accessory protein MauD